jgi:drug/metabolite transporter (DMT)-like permease
LALALFAFVMQGSSDFWLKSAVVQKGDPFSIMAMTVPSFVVASAISGLLLGSLRFDGATLGFGILAGFLSLLAMNLFVSSLKEGEASVNTVLFRLSFVVTSFLAIYLLRESAGWSKWAGLAFAAGAVCSVSLGGRVPGRRFGRTTSLAIAALAVYGINGFFFKVAALNGVSPPAYAVVTSITFGSLSAIIHFLPWGGIRFQPSPVVVRYGLLSGLLQAFSYNSIVWSMRLGAEASVVVPILQLSFVLTAALAVISLKEPVNRRKVLGFVLAILALTLLAL